MTLNDLKRAILLDPWDDDAKMAYADMLEEEGADPARVAWHREPLNDCSRRGTTRRKVSMSRILESLPGVFPRTINLKPASVDGWAYYGEDYYGEVRNQRTTRVMTGRFWVVRLKQIDLVYRYGWLTDIAIRWNQLVRFGSKLFALQPVRDVRIFNPPYDNDPDNPYGGPQCRWGWRARKLGQSHVRGGIPSRLYDLLEGGELVTYRGHEKRLYPTAKDAYYAAGDACVSYGRLRAGLPALEGRDDD